VLKASENYVKKIVEEGMRIDERKFDQFRQIEVETNFIKKAEGSARVAIGKSVVIVGVKMAVGEPFPDNPNEGVLMVNAELDPSRRRTLSPGRRAKPRLSSQGCVDRGLRESKCIDLEKLCIKEGEKVWMVNVDIHVIDHDGNLIDSSIARIHSGR
jgi:exosome complex component RRP42